eukprot:Colp12_sorted_trinity150504_noHs@35053
MVKAAKSAGQKKNALAPTQTHMKAYKNAKSAFAALGPMSLVGLSEETLNLLSEHFEKCKTPEEEVETAAEERRMKKQEKEEEEEEKRKRAASAIALKFTKHYTCALQSISNNNYVMKRALPTLEVGQIPSNLTIEEGKNHLVLLKMKEGTTLQFSIALKSEMGAVYNALVSAFKNEKPTNDKGKAMTLQEWAAVNFEHSLTTVNRMRALNKLVKLADRIRYVSLF